MPTGLGDFINHSHAPNPVGRKELDRRSNLGNLKVNRESIYGAAPKWGFQKSQMPTANPHIEEDLFAGSVLDESDDTARDINVRGNGRNQSIQPTGDMPVEDVVSVDEGSDDDDEGGKNGGTYRYFDTNYGRRVTGRAYNGNRIDERQIERGSLPPSNPQADVVVQRFQNIKNDPAFSAAVKIYETRNVDIRTPFIGRFQAIPQSYLGQSSLNTGQNPPEQNGATSSDNVQRGSYSHATDRQLNPGKTIGGRDRLIAEMDRDGIDGEDARSDVDESTVHSSPSQPESQAVKREREQILGGGSSGNIRRPFVQLDYEEAFLSRMQYSDLKEQPFDANPMAPPSVVPEILQSPKASLDERLQHFAGQNPDLQHRFFAEMPINQWEDSGDWFLGRFGDIMSRLRDARKAKRDLSQAFEGELAVREEAVRGKADGIQEVMRQMRAGGEGVLKGRTP